MMVKARKTILTIHSHPSNRVLEKMLESFSISCGVMLDDILEKV